MHLFVEMQIRWMTIEGSVSLIFSLFNVDVLEIV